MFRFGSRKDVNCEFKCGIRLLDDNEVLQTEFKREQKGQFLLDFVFKSLNLIERDYFGLRFVDQNKQRNWLDPTRSIIKQVKGVDPIVFCFRVKFYAADPSLLKEEITRYFLYLQLRRDLLHGRLYCMPSDAAVLMAFVIQSELGDFDPEEHVGEYVSEFKLLLNQTSKMETQVMDIHKNEMRGQTPAEAELNFLKKASHLETYGIDPHPVKDQRGNQLYLGVNHSGILAFQGSRKTHHFKWSELQKITYESRMFIAHCLINDKKHLIGFKCPNISSCHYLWRCAVEQRYFFTMNSSRDIPFVTTGGGMFSRSTKLRYSGRTEREIIEDMKRVDRVSASIHRSYSITSAPPSMRTLGRSNTAPLPHHESPERSTYYHSKVVPYLNYSTLSEPCDEHNPHIDPEANEVHPNANVSLPPSLDPFDEEDWDLSMTSSLPTEFDLRPDLTPTGEECHTLSFETPEVRSSPSHMASNGTDSDEPFEQNSDILEKKSTSSQSKGSVNSCRALPPKPLTKLYAIVRTSILSSLLVMLFFSCLLVVIIESDSDLFSHLRKLPELVVLRRDYYEPFKDIVWQSIGK
ncbi:unnamed protein product [Medioppia subpectinata]|uniref:Moesin/ezrin/radixin homolog 1 n=2 Tax=Medioppia subpectinata TaxID=1979941 RepID=A0A7R9L7G9_9ACAR|nr:unnamed protein product [Medioppia subpectinata]CAG2116664.1 unnamed protein product [Medioppia subpectinata]